MCRDQSSRGMVVMTELLQRRETNERSEQATNGPRGASSDDIRATSVCHELFGIVSRQQPGIRQSHSGFNPLAEGLPRCEKPRNQACRRTRGWHSLLQAVCAALETWSWCSIQIRRVVLESALTPSFRCLRHTGSLNLCHPRFLCNWREPGLAPCG